MPIDLSQVDWLYLGVLLVLVFLANLVGNLVAFQRRMTAAFYAALAFAVLFLGWTYYPHGLPLPTRMAGEKTAAAPAPAAPAMPAQPVRPANPVTDITPPRNPVTDITPPGNR